MPQIPNPSSGMKPPQFIDVRLFFESKIAAIGYWTGHEWLVEGGVVHPVAWEFVRPKWADH